MQSLSPGLAHAVFEAAPDAMVIVDESGTVLYANRQVLMLFGLQSEDIIGQSVERLMPPRYRNGHHNHRLRYARNVHARAMGVGLELHGQRQDGTEFPVEISLSPIEDAGRRLVAAAIRDVSDRKHVERKLTIARREAEQAREAADRANQAKSRFLATASHDLRQPLQTLAMLNGALRRKVSDADAREALAYQEQAIAAMSQLMNALLDISKLESGVIQPDPTDFAVAALFEDLRRDFADVAADKGLRLEVGQAEDYVHSDRSLVGQLLRNLVANAIKYTRQGCVSLRCLRAAGQNIRVEVLDTGIGIPQAQIPYIYDEFYQIDVPAAQARNGYGLGLSIVRRIVALLDLKLDVHSEVGRGSSFTLELPAATGALAAAPQSELALRKPPHRHAHLLLVEDDASVRTAAKILLEVEDFRVTAVASRAEALQVADGADGEDAIDLVVTDYHLSHDETGIHVVTALRERLGERLPAVLLTGDTSSLVNALTAVPNLEVARKPIDADELFTVIDALLAGNIGSPLRQ